MRTLAYMLLLLVAFAIGMVGTIAASRALVTAASTGPDTLEQPTGSPARAPLPVRADRPPTVEC